MYVVHHKKEDGRVTLESKPMRSRLIKEGLSGGMDRGGYRWRENRKKRHNVRTKEA